MSASNNDYRTILQLGVGANNV